MIPVIAAVIFSVTLAGFDAPNVISLLDVVIIFISYGGARESAGRSPKVAALYLILCIWACVQFCISVPRDVSLIYGLLAGCLFLAWETKTLLIRPVKSDEYQPVYYFYAVLPPAGMLGACNLARPSTMIEFGGRAIIGDGWVWCVNKNHFTKIPLSRVDMSTAILVNTGEPVNKKTTKILDAKVGTKAVMFLNDCSTLRTSQTLEYTLLKRLITRKSSIKSPL